MLTITKQNKQNGIKATLYNAFAVRWQIVSRLCERAITRL